MSQDILKKHLLFSQDQIRIQYYQVNAAHAKAIMLILPCGGGYITDQYLNLAKHLAEIDISCYLMDPRGHGLSEGRRGDTPSKEAIWQDMADWIELVRKEQPGLPIMLSGHSITAGLVLNFLSSPYYQPHSLQSLLFIAPNFGIYSNTFKPNSQDPFVAKVKHWVHKLYELSGRRWFKHLYFVYLRFSAELKKHYPLLLNAYTLEMIKAIHPENPQELLKKITVPFQIIVGENDPLVDAHKLEGFATIAPSFQKIHTVPRLQHFNVLAAVPAILAQELEHLISSRG